LAIYFTHLAAQTRRPRPPPRHPPASAAGRVMLDLGPPAPADPDQDKMDFQPTLSQVAQLARDWAMVPVHTSLPAATREPDEAFLVLKSLSRQAFILESLAEADDRGRYTFLGYDPKLCLTCRSGLLTIANGARFEIATTDPGQHIQRVLDDNRSPILPGLPPFTGGLVGYFAYDYIKYAEPSLARQGLGAQDDEAFQDVDLMLFDKVVAYDHLEGRIHLIANVRTDAVPENYRRACAQLEQLADLIAHGQPADPPPLRLTSPFEPLFSPERYGAMVEQARHLIHEGDIFQVVLSNRWSAEATGSLFETYRRLRQINPSPYLFYLASDDVEIAGASPETLVRLRQGRAATFPLAGTRPRGQTPAQDLALERELLADRKELSEHDMLVDLGRNDLGKVCRFGSVAVERYRAVERYSHVMHIASAVAGQVRDDQSAVDVIAAVLPAGTLSGAPKIRACQIIDQLEDNTRGIYGGALGYLSLTGEVDTCIAIRLAFKRHQRVHVRAGAGIVADSDPAKEHQECHNKAQAVVDALLASAQERP
jgi:anthranilate synthase component 1